MSTRFKQWLNLTYPQNYIIKNPYRGALLLALFCFGFILLYHPLNTQKAPALSFEQTMAIYSLMVALSSFLVIKILKLIPYFSKEKDWTFSKELFAILITLLGLGIAIYLLAFVVEPPANRWNLSTFLDSCLRVFLVGILPFSFFTLINYKHLQSHETDNQNQATNTEKVETKVPENKIRIESKLKKDNLSFFPNQFLYAESDGNYVIFYLQEDHKVSKKVIRNSISNIAQQLSDTPYLVRTHRAFIVNLKKVTKKHGNASGYRLQLEGTESPIPVSRQNIKFFDQVSDRFSS
ncbi:MAG: LytR/AlgR family response regulator transcription factor [Marinifilaceae bacterium]